MKIIMLGRVSIRVRGGIPSHVKSILETFNNDKEISFINLVPSLNKNQKTKIESYEYLSNSKEIVCKSFFIRKTFAISFQFLKSFLFLLKEYPDAPIHLHLPDPLSIITVILFSNKRKLIATYHADLIGKGKIFIEIYKLFLKFLVRRNCLFLFPTQKHISSTYIKKINPRKKILPFIFKKPSFSIIEKKKIKEKFIDNQTRCLFVGRHVSYKGIEVLIEAFKQISKDTNVLLNIIGEGPLTKKLKEYAGDEKRILFLGEIDDQELKLQYANSHLFILPSISKAEAFGIVQVEAMMYSCLCLSSFLNNGVNVVNRENVSGMSFPPYDSKKLGKLITYFSKNVVQRNKFMKNAKKYSLATFASDSLKMQYKSIYKSL